MGTMLSWLWRRRRPREEPPFDWSRLPAILDAAAKARPVPLTRRLTFAEAEALAGGAGEDWARLTAALRAGDELWRLHSPEEAWRARAGRSGVALVRDGAVVAVVITLLN